MKIEINNHYFLLKDLDTFDTSLLDDYEKKVFKLIKNWVNNSQEFEFKTSGSTGNPKKIIVERKHLEASSKRTLKHLNISSKTILNCLSVEHIGGAMQVIRALVARLPLINLSPSKHPFPNKSIEWKTIGLLSLVPYQLAGLIEDKTIGEINECQAILLGGASLPTTLAKKLDSKHIINVYETYGMTETLSHIAIKHTATQTYFNTLEGVKIELDKNNCLIISDTLLELENLHTNDIVELISDNKFVWKGRFDNIINSGGLKFLTEQLEEKLRLQYPNLTFIIFSRPHPLLGEEINLLIEEVAKNKINDIELKKIFSKYEKPKNIFFIKDFIYSKTDKILRKESIERILSVN